MSKRRSITQREMQVRQRAREWTMPPIEQIVVRRRVELPSKEGDVVTFETNAYVTLVRVRWLERPAP